MGKADQLNPWIEFRRTREEYYGNVVHNVPPIVLLHSPILLKIVSTKHDLYCIRNIHLMNNDIVGANLKVLLRGQLLTERIHIRTLIAKLLVVL